jgi:hypothetical protein
MEVENPTQTKGVVDVNSIPSPEKTSPTLVEEKTKQMYIDPPNTTVETKLTHETVSPIELVNEKRNESHEPRTQAGGEPIQQEQTPTKKKMKK